MLSIKQAAEQAMKYLGELYAHAEDLAMEEVDSDDANWLITLSYLAPRRSEERYAGVNTLLPKVRHYKIFTVDKNTGEVTSMKIRNVQGV